MDDFRDRFRGASPQELVEILNSEAGNSGWVTARGFFLSALRDAFLESGLDCSSFINEGRMKLLRVKLEGNKVVPINSPMPAPTVVAPLLNYEDRDDQSVVDDLIRSISEGDAKLAQQLGPEVAAREIGELVDGAMGILRPFEELEDVDLVARLLPLSAGRLEELESIDDLTEQELALFEEAVGEDCFEADGTNEAWVVLSIESSTGEEAFLAVTVAGGSIEGVERKFVGAFSTLPEAKSALKRCGFLDAEDFRQRIRSRRA